MTKMMRDDVWQLLSDILYPDVSEMLLPQVWQKGDTAEVQLKRQEHKKKDRQPCFPCISWILRYREDYVSAWMRKSEIGNLDEKVGREIGRESRKRNSAEKLTKHLGKDL